MANELRPVAIANRQRRARPLRRDIRRLLDHLLEREDVGGGASGLSVAFVGERVIRRLHRNWMGEDSVTDVLSFPSGPAVPVPPGGEEVYLGEVVVCVSVCESASRRRRIALHLEIARMLIHGTLHILGYDHERVSDARRMRARERRYLDWYRRKGLRVVESP